jgi:uncharacterized protein YbcI
LRCASSCCDGIQPADAVTIRWSDVGRDLLKEVRTHLMETARPILEAIIEEVTGVEVLSMHRDISTITGEKA